MHLSKNSFDSFQNGAMDTKQMIDFLEHLDHCDFCLEEMITQEVQNNSITTPAYLKEQILTKASSPEIQTTKALTAASRKMQMFYCTLRTATGVIAALFLLFGIGQLNLSSLSVPQKAPVKVEAVQSPEPHIGRSQELYDFSQDLSQELLNGSRKIAHYLQNFSNKLLNGGN